MYSFNLISRPWIPVQTGQDAPGIVSLEDCLIRAHELKDVYDTSPLVQVSLYRFLFALVYRLFPAQSPKEWKTLWDRGSFDADIIRDYFKTWHDRFDLFSPEYPFMQTPEHPNEERVPINKLVLWRAAGDTPVYHDHSMDKKPSPLIPAEAARQVLTNQSFALIGGKGYNPSRINNGIASYLLGTNLFETLMLNNIIKAGIQRRIPFDSEDKPVWELSKGKMNSPRAGCAGYLDYLTFPLRKILLLPEQTESGLQISYLKLAPGAKLPKNILDPFLRYRNDEKAGWLRTKLRPERQLWRDYTTLIELSHNETAVQDSLPLSQIEQLKYEGILDEHFVCILYVGGLSSTNALIEFWRFDRLPLPLSFINNQDYISYIGNALHDATSLAEKLRKSCNRAARILLTDRAGQADRATVKQVESTISPEAQFWAGCEEPFKNMVNDLATGKGKPDEILQNWRENCQAISRKAWRQLEARIISSPRGPEAIARAYFTTKLAKK